MSALDLALTGQVVVWLAVVFAFVLSGQATLYHPLTIYVGFHAMVFVIRPLLVHCLGFYHEWQYMGLEPPPALFIRVLIVSSLGLVVFAVSSVAVGRTDARFRSAVPNPFTLEQCLALAL